MQTAAPLPARDTSMRILPVRSDSILVELADLSEALALFDALALHPIAGIREIVPAARTLLVTFDPAVLADEALVHAISALAGGERKVASGPLVEIPVRYDGEDLAEVAFMLGMSVDEVVRRHGDSTYVAAFTGFAPGFAYLSGGDPQLAVPRRASPRTQVPAGAVGLAGEFSGVYPKTSPGGWQLIGTTPLSMFDIERRPASLLQTGNRVRFIDMAKAGAQVIRPSETAKAVAGASSNAGDARPAVAAVEIQSLGLPALFQDLGRVGQAGQGISLSGAVDRASFKAANRLVGNDAGAAALEITLGSLRFRMRGRGVMALTGATAPIRIAALDGTTQSAPHHAAIALDDGDVVSIGMPAKGLRSYLAFRGGFDIAPVLGSAATDTLAQIGPRPPAAGDVVAIRTLSGGAPVTFETPAFAMPGPDETVVLDVVMGPRTDWFTSEAVKAFLSQHWSVTPQSSRVGIRLSGDALMRENKGELPSEATVRGAIQVPASGQPVLFLADHPLTGGYPVIANVATHHLDLAGQIPVGAKVRFHAVSPFAARIISGKCP